MRVLALVGRVARTTTSVLLLGETGTGKEVLARTLHDMSDRADHPFVVVDCAGLAETLFESELGRDGAKHRVVQTYPLLPQ